MQVATAVVIANMKEANENVIYIPLASSYSYVPEIDLGSCSCLNWEDIRLEIFSYWEKRYPDFLLVGLLYEMQIGKYN